MDDADRYAPHWARELQFMALDDADDEPEDEAEGGGE